MEIKSILNKVNESLSIYRAIFIPKDKTEAEDIINQLQSEDYSCVREAKTNDFRILVQTYDELSFNLDNNRLNMNMSDVSIVYTTDIINIDSIADIITQFEIKYCYILPNDI